MIEYNDLNQWESGSYIITNQAIGAVVSTERHTNDSWDCMMFQVSKGDKIFITAQGGDDPRAVSILDDEYKLVYHSDAQEKSNEKLDIEQDGFVIVNNRKSTFTTPEILHYPFSQDNTDLGRVYTTHNHGDDVEESYQVTIGENVYPAVKIGNQLWIAKNLDENLGTIGVDEWYYGGRSEKTRVNSKEIFSSKISSSSTYSTQSSLYDWNTGYDGGLGYAAKSGGSSIHVYIKIELDRPAISNQSFSFIYRDKDNPSSADVIHYPFNPSISSGNTIYENEINLSVKEYLTLVQLGINGNADNAGINVNTTIRISYGTIDCGANAITVPEALSNEENAKANNYGKLYTWNNLNENIIGKLGLNGWKLPNRNDFQTLVNYCGGTNVAGTKLKSKSVGGEDAYGYNALLCGRLTAADGFSSVGIYENALGDSYDATTATTFDMSRNYSAAYADHSYNKSSTNVARSVRLVLDIPEDGSLPDGTVKITHDKGSRNVGKGYIQDNNYQPGDLDVNEQMSLLGKYGVTKIGNQLWTTENLDEELGTLGVDEWYYNNDETTAKANNYGRLYTWNNLNTNLSKLGLSGWKLPTRNDFQTLVNYCGGTNVAGTELKSKSVGGKDTYGYNALLCGRLDSTGFSGLGVYENAIGDSFDTTTATTFDMSRNYNNAYVDHLYNKASLLARSVRLVLDIPEDGSYPEDATPLIPKKAYRPYNRNIGLGSKPYVPDSENGKVYVDDVRCDIVCPHDKPEPEAETSETNSISLDSVETVSETNIEE